MSKLATVDPTTATGRAKEIFDGPLKGKHFNIFKSMAASPATLDVYLAMSGALASGELAPAQREIVHLSVSQANGCDYCLDAHTAIGKGAGLTEEQTLEARRGELADPTLNAIAQFALAIHTKAGYADDADIKAFRDAGFSDGAIGEVIATYALAVFTNYFNHVNATVSDFPTAPALETVNS